MNHLDGLLKEFGVSSKKLAEYLNVDGSLVSKWKSGKRKIGSDYGQRIAELFTQLDQKNQFVRIEKVCGFAIDPKMPLQDLTQKVECWMLSSEFVQAEDPVEPYLPAKVETGKFYTFYGKEGKRDAVNIFLEYVLREGKPTTLWLYSREDNQWFNDEDFIQQWQDKNIRIVQNKNNINVIHPVDRRLKQVAKSMFCWMPIHLLEDAKSYYIPSYLNPEINETIFLAENKIAVIGISSDRYTEKGITYLTTNQDVLANCRTILEEEFSISKPLFERMLFEHNGKFFTQFRKVTASDRKVYFFSEAPILYLLPQEMLEKLFDANDLPKEEKKKSHGIIGQISAEALDSVDEKPSITYVIQEEQLTELLHMDFIMMRFLSHCLGTPIYASGSMFREMLRTAADALLETDNIEILITRNSITAPYDKIALCIKEKTMACIVGTHYHTEEGACALITTEEFATAALYHSCEQFVESHSPEQRTKTFVYKKIMELLEENPK